MKKFIIAAALIAAAATPSFAATTQHRHTQTPVASGSYAMTPVSAWATDGSQVLGADPDAFIRSQLVRAGNPGDLEGN